MWLLMKVIVDDEDAACADVVAAVVGVVGETSKLRAADAGQEIIVPAIATPKLATGRTNVVQTDTTESSWLSRMTPKTAHPANQTFDTRVKIMCTVEMTYAQVIWPLKL